MIMKCPNCGFENINSSNFCMECGKPLKSTESEVPTKQETVTSPTSGGKITCKLCGTENDAENNFCQMCGEKLASNEVKTNTCPNCGYRVPDGNKFCPSCGFNFVTKQQIKIPSNPAIKQEQVETLSAPLPPSNTQPQDNTQSPPPPATDDPVVATQQPQTTPPPPANVPQPIAQKPVRTPSNQFIKQLPHSDRSPKLIGRTIEIIKGERTDEKFAFTRSISLGKTSTEITFSSDDYLEAKHLIIENAPESIIVTDLESTNGTYYNVLSTVPIQTGDLFYVGDSLFGFEFMPSNEWSLNPVYERGVKLLGSLSTKKPLGRIRYYSPRGICNGVYLFWKNHFVFYDNLLPAESSSDKAVFSIRIENDKAFLEPHINNIFLKIRNRTELLLPVKIRFGIEIINISTTK